MKSETKLSKEDESSCLYPWWGPCMCMTPVGWLWRGLWWRFSFSCLWWRPSWDSAECGDTSFGSCSSIEARREDNDEFRMTISCCFPFLYRVYAHDIQVHAALRASRKSTSQELASTLTWNKNRSMMWSLPLGWLKKTKRDQWMSQALCWRAWRGFPIPPKLIPPTWPPVSMISLIRFTSAMSGSWKLMSFPLLISHPFSTWPYLLGLHPISSHPVPSLPCPFRLVPPRLLFFIQAQHILTHPHLPGQCPSFA